MTDLQLSSKLLNICKTIQESVSSWDNLVWFPHSDLWSACCIGTLIQHTQIFSALCLFFSYSLFKDLFGPNFADLLNKKVFFGVWPAAVFLKRRFAMDLLCISQQFLLTSLSKLQVLHQFYKHFFTFTQCWQACSISSENALYCHLFSGAGSSRPYGRRIHSAALTVLYYASVALCLFHTDSTQPCWYPKDPVEHTSTFFMASFRQQLIQLQK